MSSFMLYPKNKILNAFDPFSPTVICACEQGLLPGVDLFIYFAVQEPEIYSKAANDFSYSGEISETWPMKQTQNN